MYSWQQANKFKADESYLPHYLKSDNARKLVVTHRFTLYNITQKNTIVITDKSKQTKWKRKMAWFTLCPTRHALRQSIGVWPVGASHVELKGLVLHRCLTAVTMLRPPFVCALLCTKYAKRNKTSYWETFWIKRKPQSVKTHFTAHSRQSKNILPITDHTDVFLGS